MKKLQLGLLLALGFCSLPCLVDSEPSVLILAANLQQVVTSSTLEWVAVNNRQPKTFENAVVGAYQILQGIYVKLIEMW